MLHDLPRLGEIEEHAVELVDVDAVVHVADLDVERAGRAEERLDVAVRTVGEVVAELVAVHVTRGPIARSSVVVSAPEPDAGLEDPGTGEDVGEHEDRPEVLRVDHLRAPRHLQHVLGEGGPQHHESRRRASCGR